MPRGMTIQETIEFSGRAAFCSLVEVGAAPLSSATTKSTFSIFR